MNDMRSFKTRNYIENVYLGRPEDFVENVSVCNIWKIGEAGHTLFVKLQFQLHYRYITMIAT